MQSITAGEIVCTEYSDEVLRNRQVNGRIEHHTYLTSPSA